MSEAYYFINNYSSQNIKVTLKSLRPSLIFKDLIFDQCTGCREERSNIKKNMAAMPQGMFAARKVRENMGNTWERSLFESRQQERRQSQADAGDKQGQWNKPARDWAGLQFPKLNQQLLDHPPARYNSKLMNSIWGLYNRYSVHNFKKITGDVAAACGLQGHGQSELLMVQPLMPEFSVSFTPSWGSGIQQGSKPTSPASCNSHVVGADY